MPIRRSPNGAVTPVHSLVAIARNGWSRSIGTPGRNQLESVVAISRYAHAPISSPIGRPDTSRTLYFSGRQETDRKQR